MAISFKYFLSLLAVLPLALTQSVASDQANATDECATDNFFVIDSSGSVRDSFDAYRHYLRQLLSSVSISPSGHHAGLMVYSGRLRHFTKQALDEGPQEQEFILRKINRLRFMNGVTATGVALDFAYRELNKRRKGVRTNVVVFTDGFSYDPTDAPAAILHSLDDVRTFAVSLDDVRVDAELQTIAGAAENVFIGTDSVEGLAQRMLECTKSVEANPGGAGQGNNASAEQQTGSVSGTAEDQGYSVPSAEKQVEVPPASGAADGTPQGSQNGNVPQADQERGNEAGPPGSKPRQKKCPMNIQFVLDASGSLREHFERQKELAVQIVEALPRREHNQLHFGLVKFSGKGHSKVMLPINNRLSRSEVQQLIRSQYHFGGTTFLNEALEKTMDQMDEEQQQNLASDTEKVQNVVIVFTDGMSQEDPSPGANALRQKGALIYAVASENMPINLKELEMVAGDPSRVFTAKNIEMLRQTLQETVANTC